jgi:hypothetical protein
LQTSISTKSTHQEFRWILTKHVSQNQKKNFTCVSFVGRILLTKSLACNVVVIIRDVVYFRVFISEKCFKMFKEDSMQIPTQKSRIPRFRSDGLVMRSDAHQCQEAEGCICPDVMATHPGALQSSRRIRFSFEDTYMGRQLHPLGRQGNTIRTRSLIRQYMEKNCNRLDVKATIMKITCSRVATVQTLG